MKTKIPAVVLIICLVCVAVALAQTSISTTSTAPTTSTSTPVVFGHGTPNFIPIWTGGSTLGNSVMFQTGGNVGVGTSSPQAGLDVASGDSTAIHGTTFSTDSFTTGVDGVATATTGNAYGVRGETATTGFGAGVAGQATAITGNAFGVFGQSSGTDGNGVFGYASSQSGNTVGVSGFIESPSGTAGRFVSHSGSGLLLQGNSGSSFTQVFNVDASGNAFFAGNLNVTGTVSKGGGSFRIDHPLDPSNKTLSHSFVESPDMMNIYNGVANLDTKGQASVSLPDWFESLNGDYRYLLTAIGASQPDLYIAEEVHSNRFRIAGGKPGAKVSWQVTGIRHDAYANAHRIRVEEDKPAAERGSYMHPEAVRQQETRGLANAQRR